ncbi:unnamed protein product [Vitrella brassicaformis CCMP3155]|uniref:Uncharacterized protein n=2 Tax=Vitrella brassicaformis TaxID=1169539 RepID=A0A0G4EFA7_VITBC|nr:unnamed protein product [Vitrella brassicaformis CCMP3155]|eukprot:CEL94102.1 unnamed protein product [Vitrella brassicaformis CCMP3155]
MTGSIWVVFPKHEVSEECTVYLGGTKRREERFGQSRFGGRTEERVELRMDRVAGVREEHAFYHVKTDDCLDEVIIEASGVKHRVPRGHVSYICEDDNHSIGIIIVGSMISGSSGVIGDLALLKTSHLRFRAKPWTPKEVVLFLMGAVFKMERGVSVSAWEKWLRRQR